MTLDGVDMCINNLGPTPRGDVNGRPTYVVLILVLLMFMAQTLLSKLKWYLTTELIILVYFLQSLIQC